MNNKYRVSEPKIERLSIQTDNPRSYLISVPWYTAYLSYKAGGLPPGKINNSPLLDIYGNLKPHLSEGIDFKQLSEPEWNALLFEFGSEEGHIHRANRSPFRSVSSAGYGDETQREELTELKIPVSARKEFNGQLSKSFENNSKVATVDSENPKAQVLKISSKSGLQKYESSHAFNSVLQVLFTIEPLVDYFVQNSGIGQFFNSEFLVSFSKLCLSVVFLRSGVIFTENFSQSISLTNIDPASVFQAIVNKIDLELGSGNFLQNYVFDGVLNVEIQCLSCGAESSYLMKFLYLHLKCTKNIENSLEAFARSTTANGYCEHCCKDAGIQKRLSVHSAPNFLVLIVNRTQESNEKKFKVCGYKRKMKMVNDYRLIAVIASCTSGFASYCKRKKNWFLYEDEKFLKAEPATVLSNVAHVLLYKKINN